MILASQTYSQKYNIDLSPFLKIKDTTGKWMPKAPIVAQKRDIDLSTYLKTTDTAGKWMPKGAVITVTEKDSAGKAYTDAKVKGLASAAYADQLYAASVNAITSVAKKADSMSAALSKAIAKFDSLMARSNSKLEKIEKLIEADTLDSATLQILTILKPLSPGEISSLPADKNKLVFDGQQLLKGDGKNWVSIGKTN